MADSVQPHRWQPSRLPHPWDSPGKNTVVGCHFLLQCMKVKSESEVAQSYPPLSDPMDCSLPGSSVHGILQAGVLESGAITFPGAIGRGRLYLGNNGGEYQIGQTIILKSISSLPVLDRYLTLSLFNINLGPIL